MEFALVLAALAGDPLRDARLRQGVQLLDRPDAPRERGRALGGGQQQPGAGTLQEYIQQQADTPELRNGGTTRSRPLADLHQLSERTGERRRPGAREREHHLQLAAFPRQRIGIAQTTITGSATMRLEAAHELLRRGAREPADTRRPGRGRRRARDRRHLVAARSSPMFMVFVVDVGNWFVHKRHLRCRPTRARWPAGGLHVPCADAPIVAEARKHAGDA